MNRKRKILSICLSVYLSISSVPPQEVHASWFSDLCGGLFTIVSWPIWVFCPDNPTFRKNNPFKKKKWEEDINFKFQPEEPKDDYKLHPPRRTNYSDKEFLKREQEKQKEELEFLHKEINLLQKQLDGRNGNIFNTSDLMEKYEKDEIFRQWVISNLTGPAGPKGDKGDKGDTGKNGRDGEDFNPYKPRPTPTAPPAR